MLVMWIAAPVSTMKVAIACMGSPANALALWMAFSNELALLVTAFNARLRNSLVDHTVLPALDGLGGTGNHLRAVLLPVRGQMITGSLSSVKIRGWRLKETLPNALGAIVAAKTDGVELSVRLGGLLG